ncbi:SH3 domain-containing protein [Flavobacterium sp.]|uniref:SH3 domain-containing protein n=1 Tax=Flavobacterium sp. TaxID=239 RepID=UPI00286DA56A|nr:SH3 domain-containing protein [Flavobacterium sp.]
MYRYIIFLFLTLNSCKSESQESLGSIIELKKAYSKNDDALFIKNFPKNHKQFVSYFGWNDILDKPFPLYNENEKYIEKFFNIVSKNENKEFLKLIIDIGVNGKYQADAVSYFKMQTEKIFIKNPNLVCELLKDRKTRDVDSFWYFYIDSPQPLTIVPKYFDKLKNNCNPIYKSLEKQIKLSQNENIVSEVTDVNKSNKLKSIEDFIPKGFIILDSLSGDLNNDKLVDKIIILANEQEFKNNESRIFLILINDNNSGFILKTKNKNVIPCLKCAGGSGGEDSYSDLSLKKNLFSFTQLKINDSKLIEKKYEFQSIGGEIFLNKVTIIKSDLYNDSEPKEKKVINNLKININNFNYNNFEKNISVTVKIQDPDGYTNLRKEKSTTSPVLEKVKTGESVEVIEQSGDWFLVKTKAGNQGYVFKTKIKSE